MGSNQDSTLVLSAADVDQLLPVRSCVQVMRRAFGWLAEGAVVQPERLVVTLPGGAGALGAMPALLLEEELMGTKVVSVLPDNRQYGMDSHQGAVLLFDATSGRLLALMDAAVVTAVRTAAVSALATDLLANQDADRLALLGSGTQASLHLAALAGVRPLREARVWSLHPDHAEAFQEREQRLYDFPVVKAASPRECVAGASLVVTATTARAPVLEGAWLEAGAHVNAVGASTPGFRELDDEVVKRARVFVDAREAALAGADDIRLPLEAGTIVPSHLLGDLADLVSARVKGRQSEIDVTLFKSVGLALEDVAAAAYIYRRAVAAGVGLAVPFSHRRPD
jgi:alanine dehydrogenase